MLSNLRRCCHAGLSVNVECGPRRNSRKWECILTCTRCYATSIGEGIDAQSALDTSIEQWNVALDAAKGGKV